MRVLLVNKFHYLKGGSEKYYFELGKLLKEHGHEVAYFSMKNEKNINTGDKEYFVEELDLNTGSKLKALDVIYSKENKKKMKEALEDFKPDIVHINNFQRQLSASIIDAIKEKNIPIVFTAHDVQAICPAITMIDNNKEICEKCIGGKYSNCIRKKCNKGSTLKSIIGALEGYYYRNKKIYTKKIDKIITPTSFYKNKLIQDGIDEKRIVDIHNFINTEDYQVELEDDEYALYLGRLSKEKGILNLIQAIKNIENGILYIAGDGPEKENIEKFIKDNKLEGRIKLLGFLNKEQVTDTIRKSKFVVVPSIWYENCPYSILETLTIGKPVIGSNIAGIAELVKDNKTGLLFKYNSIEDLSKKMNVLFNDDNKLAMKLGRSAKENAIKEFNRENYYHKIIKIYESLINKE
ncbi:MAG: glycosyltransferase family 4 protein [Clostridia bacterium]|nr:glycosyltransferase family 4 protein [Clostridia bacterium]